MRKELQHIGEIENYLTDKMSAEDRVLFEARMAADPNLKEDVSLQKKITEKIALAAFITEVKVYQPEALINSSLPSGGSWFLNTIAAIAISSTVSLAVHAITNANDETDTNEPATASIDQSSTNNSLADDEKMLTVLTTEKSVNPEDEIHSANSNDYDSYQNNFNSRSGNNSGGNSRTSSAGDSGQVMQSLLSVSDNSSDEESVLKRLQVPFESVTMNADKDKTFYTKISKSKVFIPGGILTYEDGTPVHGMVTIQYREFRNAADMAFADIPMKQVENGTEYYFNSAGMIELRAHQERKELKIGKEKSYILNYNVTEELDSCYFWSLNEQSKTWSNLGSINDSKNGMQSDEEGFAIVEEYNEYFGAVYGKLFDNYDSVINLGNKFYLKKRGIFHNKKDETYSPVYSDTGYVYQFLPKGKYTAYITNEKRKESKVIKGIKVGYGKMTRLHIWTDNLMGTSERKNAKIYTLSKTPTKIPVTKDPLTGKIKALVNMKVIAETRPENDYTNMVQGLQCSDFGVYNCDQKGKLKSPLQISAKYADQNGNPIEISHDAMLSMIDLNINGAFKFPPRHFTCSATGKNLLLLYSKNRIYYISQAGFEKMNVKESGAHTFEMKDVTDQLRNTDDLRILIGIK